MDSDSSNRSCFDSGNARNSSAMLAGSTRSKKAAKLGVGESAIASISSGAASTNRAASTSAALNFWETILPLNQYAINKPAKKQPIAINIL